MAKRPSLRGTGREALIAATGEELPEPEHNEHVTIAGAGPVAPERSSRNEGDATVLAKSLTSANKSGVRASRPRNRSQLPVALWLRGVTAVVEELVAFGGERLRQTMAAGQALCKCRTPAETIGVQMEFVRKTTVHYGKESLKLVLLARSAWAELRDITANARPGESARKLD